MAKLNLIGTATVADVKKQFNEAFGAQLRLYNGNKVADAAETLATIGLAKDVEVDCPGTMTVAEFITRMQECGIKLKVYTCDDWVAVLDGLTLEAAGKVKKGATKADMESMLANPVAAPAPKPEPKPAAEPKPVEEKKPEPKPNVEGSKADIAGARVRVYGKAQNRTALGIMHAYMVMYPQAKLEDLQKAFPDTLNPDSGVKKNLVYAEDKGTTADWNGFFKAEDELLTMGDGKKVSVVSMWTKPSFERLVAWAKQYGIIVAQFEAAEKGGVKGGFRLEYLNGYVPPKPKKGVPVWVWILIALFILGLIAGLIFGLNKKPETQVVEVVVHDTLYIQQIADIEKNFNNAEFEKGKADLSDEAKYVLHDLAKVMNDNPDLRLRLEGHTSAEGDAAFNQQLSEDRAQAAVTFLIEHEGIDASRLEAAGYGSSKLKNTDDPNAPENRRTEFIVIE